MIRQRNLKDMEKDEILRIINQLTHEQNIQNQHNNHAVNHVASTQPIVNSSSPAIIPQQPIDSSPSPIVSSIASPAITPAKSILGSPTPIIPQQPTNPSISHPPVVSSKLINSQGIRPKINQVFNATKVAPVVITPPSMQSSVQPSVGMRLEMFVDEVLVEKKINVSRKVHEPVPGEVAIKFDQPWEGNVCAYYTIIRESSSWFRLYYRAGHIDINALKQRRTVTNGQRTCYAESKDGGQTWVKPMLGLFEYPVGSGNMNNNIIWTDERSTENFTPFKDSNPNCDPAMRYKAIGSRLNPYLLFAMVSVDGINWRFLREDPILTIYHGKFDTQNVVFYNTEMRKYVMFYRDCLDRRTNAGRGIKVAVSDNFINWSLFQWLNWTSDRFPQEEYQLYTNSIQQYFRAPHMMIGFPNRFNQERVGYPGHPQTGVFDSILIASRDGFNWARTSEAIFRPGQQKKRWASRNNLMALNLYESKSRLDDSISEICTLSSEGYYLDICSLRRYTWRLDGFTSINAGFQEGELITKPIIFSGRILVLNLSTSAMGWIRVEIQDPSSKMAYPGYELQNCYETFGDSIAQMVAWSPVTVTEEIEDKSDHDPDLDIDDKVEDSGIKKMKQIIKVVREGYDLSELSGKPIQLRFRMKDCDLYSYQFLDKL